MIRTYATRSNAEELIPLKRSLHTQKKAAAALHDNSPLPERLDQIPANQTSLRREYVLHMQRTRGNSFVARMLATPTIQRCGDTPCNCSVEEKAEHATAAKSDPAPSVSRAEDGSTIQRSVSHSAPVMIQPFSLKKLIGGRGNDKAPRANPAPGEIDTPENEDYPRGTDDDYATLPPDYENDPSWHQWRSQVKMARRIMSQARYGCWCGPDDVTNLRNPRPGQKNCSDVNGYQDEIDRLCRDHDLGYDIDLQGGTINMWTPTGLNNTAHTDAAFVAGIDAALNNNALNPPLTEASKAYGTMAKVLFGAIRPGMRALFNGLSKAKQMVINAGMAALHGIKSIGQEALNLVQQGGKWLGKQAKNLGQKGLDLVQQLGGAISSGGKKLWNAIF